MTLHTLRTCKNIGDSQAPAVADGVHLSHPEWLPKAVGDLHQLLEVVHLLPYGGIIQQRHRGVGQLLGSLVPVHGHKADILGSIPESRQNK